MKVFVFIYLVLSISSINAQFNSPMFSYKDSIVVEIKESNLILYKHKFKAGNSIYSLSKSFNTSIDNILNYNKNINTNTIATGDIINIPIKKQDISSTPLNSASIPIYYKVKKKETLFRIARIYFDKAINDIIELNKLKDDHLSPDQFLQVGYFSFFKKDMLNNELEDIVKFDSIIHNNPIGIDSLNSIRPDSFDIAYDKGPAYWKKSQKNTGKKYVLYNEAKPNTEIEIYHPVTKKTVSAVVLAPIPKNTYPNNIKCILSPQVAKELRALNSRFLVEIRYRNSKLIQSPQLD